MTASIREDMLLTIGRNLLAVIEDETSNYFTKGFKERWVTKFINAINECVCTTENEI